MSYCIMRNQKCKAADIIGLQREARREMSAEKYNNNVRLEDSKNNIPLCDSDSWLRDIRQTIKSNGARERKNSVVGINSIYTASPEWFQEHTQEEILRYFNCCLRFQQSHYGEIISAVIHLDEETPHMHVMSVPITKDGRLSARDIIGNKNNMSNLQTEFYEQVGKEFGLSRGEIHDAADRRHHVSAQQHRLRKNEELLTEQQSTLTQLATQQKIACEMAVQTCEKDIEAREHLQTMKQEEKRLQNQIKALEIQIDKKSTKLINIEEQTSRALLNKRKARQEEIATINAAKKTQEELNFLQDRLKRAEYTQLLEKKIDYLESQVNRLQEEHYRQIDNELDR